MFYYVQKVGGRASFRTHHTRKQGGSGLWSRVVFLFKQFLEDKKMKKILALILAMSMTVAILSGCGAKEEAPAEVPVAEETVEATEEVTEEAAEEVVVNTVILKEADEKMLNTYSMIAVNPEAPFVDADGNAVADVAINTAGADALIQWLVTEEALALAAEYGKEEYNDTLFYVLDGVAKYEGEIAAATEETATVRLSTTTSVNDAGLLAAILPVFEEAYGYKVEIQSAGTGKAIAAAKNGNADLILVHSKSQEEAFVEEGFGRVLEGFEAERISFLYNYFVLCGPTADPAGVAAAATVLDGFKAIADGKYTFISRGDASGTHTKELSLWPEELGITTEAESFADYTEWYVSANTGMGACLVMAEEMEGYILTDKATFLTFVANDGVM